MYLGFLIDNYYLISIILILCTIIVTMVWFSRKLTSKEIVTISSMSAIIALSRGVFFWLPQFKPVSALVLVSGSIFGSLPGMLIGVMSGFLSNLIFGQGPWSPFQMLGWGLIGVVGGLIDTDRKIVAEIVGFITTFIIYGPIVNFGTMLMMTNNISWKSFLIMETSGVPLDFIHAVSTVVFVYFAWLPMRKKLVRLRDKYRILNRKLY